MDHFNPFSLRGKTILVTGASSGIGRQVAITSSRLGARVVACARKQGLLQETIHLMEGEGHQSVCAELTNMPEVEEMVMSAPQLDGVVFCAGKGLTLPFPFATQDKYEEIFAINFNSPVEALRLMVRKRKLNKGASVVFVSSVGGVSVHNVGGAVYGASKAALNATMKFCAKELAAKGIRVNSVNPGMTRTKFICRGTLTEEQFKADMGKYPLKRYGEPEDIANGIVYLLSDAAAWVTGHSLVIDGGISI